MMTSHDFVCFRTFTVGALLCLMLVACGGDDGGDPAGTGGDGSGPGGLGTGGTGSSSCAEVCAELAATPSCAQAGVTAAACEQVCTGDACASCFSASTSCGNDCEAACAAGPGGGGAGGSSSNDPPECVRNDECGISFECVSCGLNDGQGWCEQSSSCNFDADCGIDGKCGYNVETADYRCLPRAHCP